MGSDFEMIERGGGNGDLELGAFYLISSYNLLKMDMPTQTPYFSVPTKSNVWPENFFAWEKQSDQYLLSSSDKPVWPGKQHLLFNQNIVKVIDYKDSEIFASYDNSTRLLATVRNNTNAQIINF